MKRTRKGCTDFSAGRGGLICIIKTVNVIGYQLYSNKKETVKYQFHMPVSWRRAKSNACCAPASLPPDASQHPLQSFSLFCVTRRHHQQTLLPRSSRSGLLGTAELCQMHSQWIPPLAAFSRCKASFRPWSVYVREWPPRENLPCFCAVSTSVEIYGRKKKAQRKKGCDRSLIFMSVLNPLGLGILRVLFSASAKSLTQFYL